MSDWHSLTQNNEYLKLSRKRLSEPPLIWVNQFTQIINDFINQKKSTFVVNDIGCNVGHFARNVELINSNIDYRGIDISATYLEIAKHHFPGLNFYLEDFSQKNLKLPQFKCDISVVSATLEHIEDYNQFLKNIFDSTSHMVLIRTFVGKNSEKDYCLKEGANQSYLIRQFMISDLVNQDFNKDWLFELIIDDATRSEPKVICNSITRSQQILRFVKD
jgi:trans-aconitate methyltransferase